MEDLPPLAAPEDPIATHTGRHNWFALVAMLAVWLAFNFPALSGKVRFPTDFEGPKSAAAAAEPPSNPLDVDAYFATYPWRSLLGEALNEGRIPLWDPYRFAGTPFAANISMGVWYPLNWAYASGDLLRTQTVLSGLSQLIALLGAYWFFSVLRLHPYSAALGAIAFSFSGFLSGWGAHEPVVHAVIWLPLALAGVELARSERWRLGIPVTGLALALSVLAGHVQFSIYVWMAVGLWAFLSIIHDALKVRGSGKGQVLAVVGRGVGTTGCSFVIAAGLAGVQILGVAEFSKHIFRQTESYARVLETRLPYGHLATLLIADYYGNPVDGNYAGPGINYTELSLYMGLGTLMLATLALISRRDRVGAYFAILGLVGGLAALGTPVYKVLYLLVPGVSRTTQITRFILYIDFAIAGLAALGLDRLMQQRERVRRALWVLPAVAVTGGLVWLGLSRFNTTLPRAYLEPRWMLGMAFALAGAALLAAMWAFPRRTEWLALCLIGFIAADLWVFGFRYHPFQAPRELYRVSAGVQVLKDLPGARPRFAQVRDWTLPFNAAQVHELYGLNGYDPFLPASFIELITIAEDQRAGNQKNLVGPFKPETTTSPIMDLLGVQAFLEPEYGPGVVRGAFTGPFSTSNNDDRLPAAFVTRCWEVAPKEQVIRRLKQMPAAELESIAVVENERLAPRPHRRPQGCPSASPATVRSYEPERVVVRTPDNGWSMLVLTDQWFPGWVATVDSRPAKVLKVDHSFRGVVLPPGPHTVDFNFRPGWLGSGLAFTLTTAIFTAGLSLALWIRNRRVGASDL